MHNRACESSRCPKFSLKKMSADRLDVSISIPHHSEITWKCIVKFFFFCKAESVIVGSSSLDAAVDRSEWSQLSP